MSKLKFEELEDKSIKELVRLAHDTLERIKQITKEKSGGADNVLGFLGYTMLFSNILQGFAFEEASDMLNQIVSQIAKKMKRPEVGYVS